MKNFSKAITTKNRVAGAIAAFLASIIAPMAMSGPAEASEIENHTNVTMHFWLDCGVGCGNYWVLEPGETAARRDTGGMLWIGGKWTYQADSYNTETKWFCDQSGINITSNGQAYAKDDRFNRGPNPDDPSSRPVGYIHLDMLDNNNNPTDSDRELDFTVTTCQWGTP